MAHVLSVLQLTALIAVLFALAFATTAARAQEAVTTTEAETAPADEVGVPQQSDVIAPPNVLDELTTQEEQTFPVVADNVTSGPAVTTAKPSTVPPTTTRRQSSGASGTALTMAVAATAAAIIGALV